MPPIVRLLAALCAAAAAAGPGPAPPHPLDGPDADVRIRIQDEQVLVHAALNLAFVDAVVDVPRADPGAVAPSEVGPLRAALVERLRSTNAVDIDGVAVTPLDQGFELAPAPPELVALFPRFGARALARVELTLAYPAKSPPARVRLLWGSYPPNAALEGPGGAPPLEIVAQLRAEGRERTVVFRAEQPEVVWTPSGEGPEERFLAVPAVRPRGRSVPVLALGLAALGLATCAAALRARPGSVLRRRGALCAALLCAGGAVARDVGRVDFAGEVRAPTAEEARAIFRPLHANIYRAFDYDEESDIYDALARSVEGPLLDELYNAIYRSLLDQDAGGAVGRVQAVELLEAEVADPPPAELAARGGFEVRARWRVSGSVRHFGHEHERTNEYRARYGVVPAQAGWRIATCQVLEQRRVEPEAPAPLAPAAGPAPMPDLVPPPRDGR